MSGSGEGGGEERVSGPLSAGEDRVSGAADRARGAPVGFFSSRWIEPPDWVTELAGGLPRGFRAAGVACGIKQSRALDLGLLVSDAPQTTSAARFTRSGTLAAPVVRTRQRCPLGGLRATVVCSGNANAATGERGLEDATKMAQAAALAAGVVESEVAVASTGVVGVPLPIEAVTRGIAAVAGELRAGGEIDFAQAIRSTDAFAKRVSLSVSLPGGEVLLSAQAKGAGMMSPKFATLLCFVQTDAALSPETCDLLLGVTAMRSFERITVDGQLSPSDTVILQASGESGVAVAPETEDELRFGEALDALMRQLALLVVGDGEGARRVGRVLVSGGDSGAVDGVARAVANSPLVKTALYGGDPNWGRISQAVGMAMPGAAPLELGIAIEGVQVCERGAYVPHDADSLVQAVQRAEVEYEITVPGEGANAEVFFSDLGHEYVTVNADYTT
ncbi:MAG: bifunctional glutamate N-acetyltransferase/amino-acid acetyltransferase ArgJ [Actinomycetota bacterium]|nr:bifunctional glutamate N-acetyltransferase/amino-acid acetyltransferase ArgJ [Actinomycetota bacterium]